MPTSILAAFVAIVVGLALSQVANYATTIYLHRALAHRAISLSRSATFASRAVIWLTTGIKPREWAAVHRRHHAFTDVEGDPHSPRLLGWVRVQIANAALYRRCARDGVTVARYARDIPRDRWDRVLFDRAWLGFGITFALLVLLLGPVWGVAAGLVHIASYLATNAAVNAMAHTFGRRSYDNTATNLQWLAWLTGGEGLHNNHHAAPTAARLAHRRGEIDPAWPVVRVLRRLGQATVRHERPPDRQPRRPARAA